MAENKQNFEQKAKEFFEDKKNSSVNKVYVTSDGYLFRAEHYANNWSFNLKDREVEVYHRGGSSIGTILEAAKEHLKSLIAGQNADINDDETQAPSEREALVKEYIELFDTKPHHMFSDEKIKTLIAEKKAELENEGDPDQEDDADGDQDSKESEEAGQDSEQTESE